MTTLCPKWVRRKRARPGDFPLQRGARASLCVRRATLAAKPRSAAVARRVAPLRCVRSRMVAVVFFDTSEALVPSDTNNQMDVYEYEDGRQSLISSGTSPRASTFQGASESGDDVFFQSRQQLVPQDDTGEEARVIYDARVGGGFPAPAAPPPCTTADACRVPVAPLPSVFGAPASATFSGAGNLAPPPGRAAVKPKAKALTCKKDFVKKKVKCEDQMCQKADAKARKAAHAKRRGN